jgi:hypothetical protein
MGKIILGIDPGVNTGFASIQDGIFIDVLTIKVHKLIIYLSKIENKKNLIVYMEDARKRKWFGERSNVNKQGAGSIKRDCKIIEDCCNDLGIEIILIDPKDQRGLTKLTKAEFKKITGWIGVTSVHARDAAMLIFGRKS